VGDTPGVSYGSSMLTGRDRITSAFSCAREHSKTPLSSHFPKSTNATKANCSLRMNS
jgi:hypothetical protein